MKEPSYLSNELLPETCGLSLSELEGMAARQARQLETQDQLLAAKAQRLRYLKSGGEAERLQRLRDKVATQEERLRKLRALRGKVHTNRTGNSVLSSDLESLRAVFNEKEKELSVAVAKVDELTRQLEDLRRGNQESGNSTTNPSISNGQSTAAIELDKLRRELMYRQKLREAQATRVAAQRAALTQRQDESNRVDRRIAELQERLHRKRLLNHQLAATLKHQENVEDFVVGVPNKNDPKYQTLPYNAKLFAPFATKQQQQQLSKNHHHLSQDQEKFDKAIKQMQIITLDQHQQQQQQQPPGNNKMNNFTNNLQLHQLLSQNNHNTKSANNILTESHQQQASGLPSQHHLSNGLHHSVKGKSWAALGEANNGFPLVRPTNFLPTGAPSPVTDLNGLFNSQVGATKDGPSSAGSNASVSESSCDGYGTNGNTGSLQNSASTKPALPPKPAKPAPPIRQASVLQDVFSYNQRSLSTGDGTGVMPDRTELPIKPKPLFLKTDREQSNATASADKDSNGTGPGTGNNGKVRVSMNRRIEMPPAFLFPESDPPPSDLVPENSSTSTPVPGSTNELGNGTGSRSSYSSGGSQDVADASPLHPNYQTKPSILPPVEEYTLPDHFPQPPLITGLAKDKESSNSVPSTPPYATHPANHQNNNTKYYHHQEHVSEGLSNSNYSQQLAYNSSDLVSPNGNSSSLRNSINEMGMMNGHMENSHITRLSNQMGNRHSPSTAAEDDKLNAFNQPEPYEAGNENKSPNVEQSSARDESSGSSSNTPSFEVNNSGSGGVGVNNVSGSGSMSGVVRRVKKGNLKSSNKEQGSNGGRRVSFDPLALLLDASLEGELELVMKTAGEVGNPSAANDEGITALHNAICAGHADVVRFLVEFGCDVNAQDSDGWTPLHCAASCNNVGMVKFLVERGACIFATTLSDHETAAQKCEEDEDGFGPCSEYLYSIQEKLGIINGGVVYSVFDYDQQNPDELNFQEGDRLTILRKGDEFEREWWWAGIDNEKQGYVPRNLLGLYPRVQPQKRMTDES